MSFRWRVLADGPEWTRAVTEWARPEGPYEFLSDAPHLLTQLLNHGWIVLTGADLRQLLGPYIHVHGRVGQWSANVPDDAVIHISLVAVSDASEGPACDGFDGLADC